MPPGHAEKENLPGFVMLAHSLFSRSCSSPIWATLRCGYRHPLGICVPRRVTAEWLRLKRVFQGGPEQGSSWGPPQPLERGHIPDAGVLILSPSRCSSCTAAAQCRLGIRRGNALPRRVAAVPSLPRTGALLCGIPRARAFAGSEAPSIVSSCVASAGTAACSFVVWSSESPPRPQFY